MFLPFVLAGGFRGGPDGFAEDRTRKWRFTPVPPQSSDGGHVSKNLDWTSLPVRGPFPQHDTALLSNYTFPGARLQQDDRWAAENVARTRFSDARQMWDHVETRKGKDFVIENGRQT